MRWIIRLDECLAWLSRLCGWIACLAMILMAANVFYDVVARYAFNDVSIALQEMEWHLYSVVFLLGIPYALRTDGHVRVDVFYTNWSQKRKAWTNLIGAILFVIPFAYLIANYGYSYAVDAYQMGEGSGDPGGLPHRWVIKSVIPVSAFFMGTAGLNMVTYAIRVLAGDRQYEGEHSAGGLA
ncbi:TRAP transporter small permease subunit [Marinobacter daepoensis]|uniref:TRAP transporter small permease protein n=1 Tax=Marinobacter daepoensis TaxID=262077 RepID=A0ABS3BET3_9GAMM|nr:TRAP transporter small permease subunit [Marinobacter daepoensis]MBN7770344.1 TRAP transporter small permease subunit [Marinobacter daepoensis]MBY6033874.1 TRAP transporter small permease subunit [Marinobacter daepoensis]MBY6079790.1 TRAP transporter small permease subunit [Marinobacter daepoensis]